jgi:hypothetical protein
MDMAPGLLIGIIFGALNFWLLIRIVTGLVRSDEVSKSKTAFLFAIKMILLAGIIGLILWKRYVSPLSFVGGFTISLIGGIFWQMFPKKEKPNA